MSVTDGKCWGRNRSLFPLAEPRPLFTSEDMLQSRQTRIGTCLIVEVVDPSLMHKGTQAVVSLTWLSHCTAQVVDIVLRTADVGHVLR